MDGHHDCNHPDPAGELPDPSAVDEYLADRLAIPGHTRPIVWRAAPATRPGCLSTGLVRLLLNDYTRPGDVVLDVDDDVTLATIAAATGRHHHALGGAHHLAVMGHAAGYIDMILLHWPRPAVNPLWLLRACRALLGATGSLVIVVSVDADQRVAHISALVGAAATAGLRHTRHVAVLAPDAATGVAASDQKRGRYDNAQAHRPGPERRRNESGRPHTELLLFGVSTEDDKRPL